MSFFFFLASGDTRTRTYTGARASKGIVTCLCGQSCHVHGPSRNRNGPERVSAKPGLWTVDWTVDWTADWTGLWTGLGLHSQK